jgi:hypothetical protein
MHKNPTKNQIKNKEKKGKKKKEEQQHSGLRPLSSSQGHHLQPSLLLSSSPCI